MKKRFVFFMFFLFFNRCDAAEVTSLLEDVCGTLNLLHAHLPQAPPPPPPPFLLAFPYLGVPGDFELEVPYTSIIFQNHFTVSGNQVAVPVLRQTTGNWPTGGIEFTNLYTFKNITYKEIQASADGTNCGWHAIKNALCLLNVVHRSAGEKGQFVQDMQSLDVYLALLKPWLELGLRYRHDRDSGDYATYPLGNWPSESELELAVSPLDPSGITLGTAYGDQRLAVNAALQRYRWGDDADFDLGAHITSISQFASFSYRTIKDQHVQVLRAVCLPDDVTHAFVVNTVATIPDAIGSHWVTFLLYKRGGVIRWFSSDSLFGSLDTHLKDALQAIVTQTSQDLDDLEVNRRHVTVVDTSMRLVETMEARLPENQYEFKGVLVKNVAVASSNVLTKSDLVALNVKDKVEDISDALLKKMVKRVQGVKAMLRFLTKSTPTVFASWYNETTRQWWITSQGTRIETKSHTDYPFAADLPEGSAQPSREEIFQEKLGKIGVGDDDYEPVMPVHYWFAYYKKQHYTVLQADTPVPIEFFYNPSITVVDFFSLVWKVGIGYAGGTDPGMKDVADWPRSVRINVLNATTLLVRWLNAYKTENPLTKAVTIENIPDLEDGSQRGDVTKRIRDWIIMTSRKACSQDEGSKKYEIPRVVVTDLFEALKALSPDLERMVKLQVGANVTVISS